MTTDPLSAFLAGAEAARAHIEALLRSKAEGARLEADDAEEADDYSGMTFYDQVQECLIEAADEVAMLSLDGLGEER